MTAPHVDIWNNCLETIQKEVTPQSYDTWFLPIEPKRLENNVLTIQVPSQFFYEFLEDHYVVLIKKAIISALGPKGKLEYAVVIDPDINPSKIGSGSQAPAGNSSNFLTGNQLQAERPIPNPFVIPGIRKFEVDSNLNPSYTFENFVEGDCNRLARAAGYAVANKPGLTAYNPLFIYGGVGLGKTHLLQAIGNEIKKQSPQKAVLYLSSERFTNQFVDAVRNNTVNDFMNFYQLIDVLLVDDIQFFSGKSKTQDYFFHVFNHLRQSGKQIILASDRAPHKMEGVEERLLSRFKWGLSTSLEQPSYETRKSILVNKIYQDGMEFPDDVVEYIAHNITTNIRELEGALISLLAQSSLNRVEVDLTLAQSLISNFIDRVKREVTIDAIQMVVGEHLSVQVDQMKAKTRKREIVQARQIAMYFSKNLTPHSLKSIGIHFGGRDHSTVIHALNTVEDLVSTDRKFRDNVEEIRKRLSL